MSCRRWRTSLGEAALGAVVSPDLEAHFESCLDCREALKGLRGRIVRIDEELRRSSDVEPAPEFLPRLRRRLEKDPVLARPRAFGWLLPATVGAAMLAAVVHLARRPTASLPAPNPPVVAGVGRPATPPAATAQQSSPEVARRSPVGRARHTPARRPEPEILVDVREEAALRQFALSLAKGRADVGSFEQANGRTRETKEIAIMPIDVQPLEVESLLLESSLERSPS
jgi:hypothetical protein